MGFLLGLDAYRSGIEPKTVALGFPSGAVIPRFPVRKRSIIQMTLVGVAVGAALAMVAVFIPWLPEDASKQAGIVDSVYWVVTIICVVVFAVVAGVSAYAVYKFRPAETWTTGAPSTATRASRSSGR